jgi:thiol-disulfide isomerase/thioredoxin
MYNTMRKITIATYTLAVLFLSACDMFGPNDQVIIKGDIEGAEKVIVILTDTNGIQSSDTLDMVNGSFRYKTKIEAAEFFVLEFVSGLRIPVIAEPGDMITIKANAMNPMSKYEIAGNDGAEVLVKLNEYMMESIALVDSLDEVVNRVQQESPEKLGQVRMELTQIYQRQVEKHRKNLGELLRENTDNMASILILPQRLGQRELMSVVDNIELFKELLEGLEEKHPRSRHTPFLRNQIKRYERGLELQKQRQSNAGKLTPGNPVPEIEMASVSGEIMRLSDVRGKVVLLDFWAAWCGPCRRANPAVVALYEKYKNRGFTVFSVSLDGLPQQPNGRQDWLDAIEKDNLSWPYHVSEVNGWNSSVVNTFAIEGIPLTFVIDREGIIQGRNLHGEELEAKISELL